VAGIVSRTAVLILLAASLFLGGLRDARAAEPDRPGRARRAVDDLERVLERAEAKGALSPHDRIPLLVGREALAQIDRATPDEQPRIADLVYERCLQAKISLLEGKRRPPEIPPAPNLADLKLQGPNCRQGDRVVFPVACRTTPSETIQAFFSRGDLVLSTPALAGATPENVEETEVFKVYTEVPGARRVGWERPAGGFVRDAAGDKPAILTCIDHPAMRTAILAETAQAINTWVKAAQPLYHSFGGNPFYVDFSELSGTRFAAWLKERHKTIREVNTLWDTKFRAFKPDLMPTPDQPEANPSRWYDWVVFNQGRFTDHVKWAMENARSLAPGLPIGLAPLRYALAGSYGLSGVDPVALGELVDVIEIDGADALQADLAATFAGGKRAVVDPGMAPGPFGILPHMLHGVAAVRLTAWPPAPLDSVEAVLHAERALHEALDVRQLGPAIEALARVPKPVALLYSAISMIQVPDWAIRCAETPDTAELAAAYAALQPLDVGCGFVTSRDVANRGLRGASVLVVAGVSYETEQAVSSIIDYVEEGGHLVIVGEALLDDERLREAEHLLRLGIEVKDTQRPKYAAKPRPERGGALDDVVATEVPEALITPSTRGPLAHLKGPFRARGVRQTPQINVIHDVLATFPDGVPAIVTYTRGRGRITYFAMPLAPADLAACFQAVLQLARVQPVLRLIPVDGGRTLGLECRSVRREGRILAYVWNKTAQTRRVTFHAAAGQAARSLPTDERLSLQPAPDGIVVGPLTLAPFETLVLDIAR